MGLMPPGKTKSAPPQLIRTQCDDNPVHQEEALAASFVSSGAWPQLLWTRAVRNAHGMYSVTASKLAKTV